MPMAYPLVFSYLIAASLLKRPPPCKMQGGGQKNSQICSARPRQIAAGAL